MNGRIPGISRLLLRRSLRILVPILIVPSLCSCGSDSGEHEPQPVVDTTPPSPITDLVVSTVTDSSILLHWTAPSDAGAEEQVRSYDVRVSTEAITVANFDSARHVPRDVPPNPPGSVDSVLVGALAPNTTYHCAIRASDEALNLSLLSNIATAHTPAKGDIISPSAISDLTATALGESTIELTWTAPGDDGDVGTASSYDLHASSSPFPAQGFPTEDKVTTGTPAPGGTQERRVLRQLEPETRYYFVIRTADEIPNWSSGSAVVSCETPDIIPPARVKTLILKRVSLTSITVEWEATGDNGYRGLADHYDVRYAPQPLTEGNWEAATQAVGEPTPKGDSFKEQMSIANLDASALTYVALKVLDEAGNASELSNVISGAPNIPRVLRVFADGSGDTQTIQAALDIARDGDVIQVGPGAYLENLNFRGYEVQLKSTNGRDQTTIDGRNAPESVISIDHDEGAATLIEGFTIRNGHCLQSPVVARQEGGGIRIRNSRPTIRDCRIVGNSARWGGGLAVQYGGRIEFEESTTYPVQIEHCEIDSNSSFYGGGGVYLGGGYPRVVHTVIRHNRGGTNGEADGGGVFTYGPSVAFEDCVIAENIASDHGGGLALWNGSPFIATIVMRRCLILANRALKPARTMEGAGGGIHVAGCVGEITNCTIASNVGMPESTSQGGGVSLYLKNGGALSFTRNIVANNSHGGIAVWSEGVSATSNIVWNNSDQNVSGVGIGSQIVQDPLFCSPQAGDFRVAVGSPAITGQTIGVFPDPGCGQ